MSTTQSKTTTKKAVSKKPVAKKVAAPKKAAGGAAAPKKAAAAPKKAAAAPKKAAATPKKAAAPKKVAAPKQTVEETDGEGKRTRFFKVLVDNEESAHGRFSGNKPKQAANKALTSIFKAREQSGGSLTGKVKFSIVECTRGSKHKRYYYVGERVKLDTPMEVTIGKGDNKKTIKYKFNNKVMKDKTVNASA